MRFGDVQDTRKKETGKERNSRENAGFINHFEQISALNTSGMIATIGGVIFTI